MTQANAMHGRIGDLFAAVDAKDTERFLGFLTDDASFRFASAPAVQGRQAIRETVRNFLASIAACRHELARIVMEDETLVCEGNVTYTRHDGTEINLPFANVFELEGGIISAYRIYVDAGQLYE